MEKKEEQCPIFHWNNIKKSIVVFLSIAPVTYSRFRPVPLTSQPVELPVSLSRHTYHVYFRGDRNHRFLYIGTEFKHLIADHPRLFAVL